MTLLDQELKATRLKTGGRLNFDLSTDLDELLNRRKIGVMMSSKSHGVAVLFLEWCANIDDRVAWGRRLVVDQ